MHVMLYIILWHSTNGTGRAAAAAWCWQQASKTHTLGTMPQAVFISAASAACWARRARQFHRVYGM